MKWNGRKSNKIKQNKIELNKVRYAQLTTQKKFILTEKDKEI